MRIKNILTFVLFLQLCSPVFAQNSTVTLSGLVKEKTNKAILAYVNVVLKAEKDSAFVTGTVTNEEGRFTLSGVKPGNYFLEVSFVGYQKSHPKK